MSYIKFFGSRLGCKLNDIKFFEELLPKNPKIIVEGYAGSFALVRKVYKDTISEIHINDNDKSLIDTLILIRDDEKVQSYIDQYNKIIEDHKGDNKIIKEKFNNLEIPNNIKTNIMQGYKIRGFYKPVPKSLEIKPLQDLLKKCTITNDDISNILIKYQKNKDAFLFLDPPYLDSHNTTYKGNDRRDENKKINDNTQHYINLMNFIKDKKTKCKVMIILNENAIINYLFKGYIKKVYEKTYQLTKNKTNHVIITNF